MAYRRSGRSGLDQPAISLGISHNFGEDRPLATQRAIVRRAFDLGVTRFDLANNDGPPCRSAEENFGRILAARTRSRAAPAIDLDHGDCHTIRYSVRGRHVAFATGGRVRITVAERERH